MRSSWNKAGGPSTPYNCGPYTRRRDADRNRKNTVCWRWRRRPELGCRGQGTPRIASDTRSWPKGTGQTLPQSLQSAWSLPTPGFSNSNPSNVYVREHSSAALKALCGTFLQQLQDTDTLTPFRLLGGRTEGKSQAR